MFRLNVRRSELARFVAPKKDRAPCFFRVPFKHEWLSMERPHCSLGPIVDENSGGPKTPFWHFSITKISLQLLNGHSTQAPKITTITTLVAFSKTTGVC